MFFKKIHFSILNDSKSNSTTENTNKENMLQLKTKLLTIIQLDL